MNKRSQWLFETPVVLEKDLYNSPYFNPKYYNDSEWESDGYASPKNLKLVDHFHIPKSLPSGKAGTLTRLVAQNMNPGFIDANDNLIVDTSTSGLQTCLQKLITTQFQNYLSNKNNIAPSVGDRLRVALVDLTGNKLTQPDFAGWGYNNSMYGASVPKISALYAAYQLLMDLRQLAVSQSISNGKTLEKIALQSWALQGNSPNLVWLFNIHKWSGSPTTIDFSTSARKVFQGIMHNAEAGELIIKVGFPYIASVTWQSGLHHPNRSGLWLTSAYGKGRWNGNPIKGVNSANITALAVANYFTLLAQGRLVDNSSSNAIKTWLGNGCSTSLFPKNLGLVASKCGIWSDYLHDCVLINRGNIRYVVVGLTRTNRREYSKYTQLFLELDKLIVSNNQKPKPLC